MACLGIALIGPITSNSVWQEAAEVTAMVAEAGTMAGAGEDTTGADAMVEAGAMVILAIPVLVSTSAHPCILTTANQAGMQSGVTSAVVGTALGAAAGAAIGGGSGAAIGAGTGFAGGSIVGAGTAVSSMYENQQRYDAAYIQCMYAKGHQVPVQGQFSSVSPPQATHIPPPPPGLSPPSPK